MEESQAPEEAAASTEWPFRGARLGARLLVVLLLVGTPFATMLLAIRYAPPTRVEIAGHPVSVKPVLGQDTTRLQNGAIVRPEHARIPLLGKVVGVDIEADWNRLIPSDKGTRQYLSAMWEDPDPEVARLQAGAKDYMVRWTVIGFSGGLAISLVTLSLLLQRRRRMQGYAPEVARLIGAHNRRLRWTACAAGVGVLLAVDVAAIRVYTHEDHHVVLSSPIFAGTAMEGTEVDGLIGKILPFLSIVQPRTTFYDTVAKNLQATIDGQPGLRDAVDGSNDGEVVFVVAEDFEDVNGMARQVGLAADLVDADFVALSGDLTFAGKAIESYIIDTVNYYSGDRPVYFAPGLHDTPVIVQAAKARGWHVADGITQQIGALTLLSAGDPRISTVGNFGSGDVLRDPEVDTDAFVANTIEEACRLHPDFILLHDHVLGRRIADAGCQEVAVLDGRSFAFVGPRQLPLSSGGTSTEFTSGSSGGHADTAPDPGTIKHPARFVVFRFDPETRQTHYFVFTVKPDASVSVTPGINLEVEYADFLATGRTEPPPVNPLDSLTGTAKGAGKGAGRDTAKGAGKGADKEAPGPS